MAEFARIQLLFRMASKEKALHQMWHFVLRERLHVVALDPCPPAMAALRAFKRRNVRRRHRLAPLFLMFAGQHTAEPVAAGMGTMHQIARQHDRTSMKQRKENLIGTRMVARAAVCAKRYLHFF